MLGLLSGEQRLQGSRQAAEDRFGVELRLFLGREPHDHLAHVDHLGGRRRPR
jgi:hypothetical protein